MKQTLLALLFSVGFAQSPVAQTPTFDVADVHVSKPGETPAGGMIPGSGRLEFRSLTMVDLIRFAYALDDDMILGGPDWLAYDHFDVYAKGARGSSDETVKLTLRALLVDRFKLVFHTVEKPMPAYVLTVGKKVLMKEAAEGEDSDCQPEGGDDGLITVACKNLTMPAFAQRIHMYAGGYLQHPVVDQTGLTGSYDFTLRWTGKGQLAASANGISIFAAVEKELGLKLEEKKLPVGVMSIDSVNETPTPNAPGVKETLPVTATEFEVADIRVSPPGTKESGGFKPGGRLDFRAISIKDLLPFVYDVDPNMIVGMPKWMETEKFDIVAKAPREVDMESLRVMLRSLFVERFKIEEHKAEQPIDVYVMVAAKRGAKVEKAAPAERPGCKRGVENNMIVYACKGTTMAQFAEQIHRFAGGYLDHPVVDETELTGGYDFTVSWTPRGRLMGGGRGGDAPPPSSAGGGVAPVASDPSGLSFFEAAERQLGLRFEAAKRPMQVIVIDRATPLAPGN